MRIEVMKGVPPPFLGTTPGAARALFTRKEWNQGVQRSLTGFAAGAMVYVAVEMSPEMSQGAALQSGYGLFRLGVHADADTGCGAGVGTDESMLAIYISAARSQWDKERQKGDERI